MTCRRHLWKGEASWVLGFWWRPVVCKASPVPKCVWKRVRKSSSPHFVCLLRLVSCDCFAGKLQDKFHLDTVEASRRMSAVFFSGRENKAPSMNTNKTIKRKKNLRGHRLGESGALLAWPPARSVGRRLTSARSLIEALNLALPRMEGNQGRAEPPARRHRPSAAMESGARTLSSAADASQMISAGRARPDLFPIQVLGGEMPASHKRGV